MRISDWSSDVCSSDLFLRPVADKSQSHTHHSENGGESTRKAMQFVTPDPVELEFGDVDCIEEPPERTHAHPEHCCDARPCMPTREMLFLSLLFERIDGTESH